MLKKIKIGIILSLILFLTLGIVSASEDNINQTENSSDFLINEKSTIQIEGGTFDDIQNVIDNSSDGDTIELIGNFEGTSTPITISKSINIKGCQNTILDGKKSSGIFEFKGNTNILITNITFVNANSNGAIYKSSHDFYNAYSGHYQILNCNFKDNCAISAPCINVNANILHLDNCNFTNNHAESVGSIKVLCNDFKVINSNFINNSADKESGAIKLRSLNRYNLENCNFINNSIYSNKSYSRDAGALIIHENGNGNIKNCNFINNFVFNTEHLNSMIESYGVGAIYSQNNLEIEGCNFTKNSGTAKYGYGAIYLTCGNISVRNCNFNNNHAKNSGGAINCGSSKVFVENSSFNNNSAWGGGAIDANNLTCKKSSFTNNSANYFGGAIYSPYGPLIIDCFFSNNNAKGKQGDGGAIYSYIDDVVVFNSTFYDNHATLRGGAIYSQNTSLENCTFYGNVAKHGGAINSVSSMIVNCTFEKNKADESGAIESSNLFIFDSRFIANNAKQAGAINCYYFNIVNSTFKSNTVENYGSAIVCNYNGELNITNSTFSDNIANAKKNEYGFLKNYGNSAIAAVGDEYTLKIVNCTGLVNNKDKFKSKTIISAKPITLTYKQSKNLVAYLNSVFDNYPLEGLKVTIALNQKYNKYSDNNGMVKLAIPKLIPKTYYATISYLGDNFNLKASKTIKITVKKLTPKITASSKTFKAKQKTKKYTITLKNEKNKYMKSTIVTLKIKGKLYSVKTNSYGKATFKITKLNKKGIYNAVVTYKGNAYYNKITKNIKIICK